MKVGGIHPFPEAEASSAALAAVVTRGTSWWTRVREGIDAATMEPPILLVQCLWDI